MSNGLKFLTLSAPTKKWCAYTCTMSCRICNSSLKRAACCSACSALAPFLAARKFSGARLFYWAASRHRLCLYWPVSRCAFGREGVSPDLPLPGWESTGRHSWAGVERSWPRGGRSPSRLWWVERS